MSYRTVDAARPVEWIKSAFATFQQAPLPFVAMTAIMGAIWFVLIFIPLLGPVILAALGVYWVAGFQHAARKLESGGTAEITDLFAGLSGDRLVPLAYIAALPAGVALVAGLLGTFGAILSIPVNIAVWIAIYFAVPRVYFERVEPIAAMQQGLQASLANILPLIVVTVLNFTLIFGGMLALLVGLLVTLPVMLLGTYHGYRDVYGAAGGYAAAPGPMPPPPPPGPPGPPPGY
jgi:uncharacterized membrane protein